MVLYIIKFRNEPLIKIGISRDPFKRIIDLKGESKLLESYYVIGKDSRSVRILERNLHYIFAEYRRDPARNLSSGNTEVFDSCILPQVLKFVEEFSKLFPPCCFCVQKVGPIKKAIKIERRKREFKTNRCEGCNRDFKGAQSKRYCSPDCYKHKHQGSLAAR